MRFLRWSLALAFLGAGAMKLAGQKQMVDAFRRWGYPRWFRWATGASELVGAGLLARPETARAGAAELSGLMAGAAYTHLKTPGEEKMVAVPLAMLPLLGWIAARGDSEA